MQILRGKDIIKIGWGTLFSLLVSFHLQAQNIGGTYQLGQRFVKIGNYPAAIKTFQRILYFTDDTLRGPSYFSLAHCYLQQEQYKKARECYELAYFSYDDDSIKHHLLLKKVHTQLISKKFQFALIDLFNLPDELPPAQHKIRQLYLGITYFGLENFAKSKNYFKKTLSDTAQFYKKKIDEAFHRIKKINRLNPKTAKILSIILPGLGQIYAGDIKEGLNSFLLTSGFLVLGISAAVNLTVLDAILAITPWYVRYYYGGIQNAEKIARHRIKEKRSKVFQSILDIITRSNDTQP